MVELLVRIESLRERAEEIRKELPPNKDEEHESRIQSVYASLAIEDQSVTIEEVREVLASNVDE